MTGTFDLETHMAAVDGVSIHSHVWEEDGRAVDLFSDFTY